jgi:hypothetical protein
MHPPTWAGKAKPQETHVLRSSDRLMETGAGRVEASEVIPLRVLTGLGRAAKGPPPGLRIPVSSGCRKGAARGLSRRETLPRPNFCAGIATPEFFPLANTGFAQKYSNCRWFRLAAIS